MQRDLVIRASRGDHDAFASLATNASMTIPANIPPLT